jgi:hypothetical protein
MNELKPNLAADQEKQEYQALARPEDVMVQRRKQIALDPSKPVSSVLSVVRFCL